MRKIFIFLIAVLIGGCGLFKKTKSGKCEAQGRVVDYTGLDGCGLLIELENGDKLLPSKVKDNFPLKDGQRIRFSYKVLNGMMSICMAEKAIVEITCISEAPPPSSPSDCADTMNPLSVPWMDKAFDRHNPTQVIKYKNGKEWVYLFYAIPVSWLYDCRGKLICQTKTGSQDDCQKEKIESLGRGKLIWQGEGVWD